VVQSSDEVSVSGQHDDVDEERAQQWSCVLMKQQVDIMGGLDWARFHVPPNTL